MRINSRLGIFQRLWGDLKVLFIALKENLRELGHVKPRNGWIGNESKKDKFATATAISKRANANLAIKILRYTFSWRWVTSTKPYISKKNKMSRLKFACAIVFISAMSQSLTCSIETREGSFDAILRNDIPLNALKAALNLEKEEWWCLAWFLLLVQNLASGHMVKLTQLYTKRYWRNMYLIWELQLINQLYLCKITHLVTLRSLFKHFFLKKM